MTNLITKPKLTARQLINKMKYEQGIFFNITCEKDAEIFLSIKNNYFRTAAYRKNYQKNTRGKYNNLEFAYLQELATLDMHFRFLVTKMCLDIEHSLKIILLSDIETNPLTDGYDIVKQFLSQQPHILKKIEVSSASPFIGDMIQKYFLINKVYHSNGQKSKNIIVSYDKCPVWVLMEIITFGDFIKFYDLFYSKTQLPRFSTSLINLVKSLRNACAHNNCTLANLAHGTSRAPAAISQAISKIPDINPSQRKKKLSCRPMLEFTCLLYIYSHVVSDKVRKHRINELRWLFYKRMPEKKTFFAKNELLKSNYEFAAKLINFFFSD